MYRLGSGNLLPRKFTNHPGLSGRKVIYGVSSPAVGLTGVSFLLCPSSLRDFFHIYQLFPATSVQNWKNCVYVRGMYKTAGQTLGIKRF